MLKNCQKMKKQLDLFVLDYKIKIVKNPSPVVLDCTFTMYWPRVYCISQWWNLGEKERASPPSQFIALQAINELKGTISG